MAAQAQVVVRVVDQASQALGKIAGSVDKLEGRTTGLKKSTRKASSGFGDMVQGLRDLAALAGVGLGLSQLVAGFSSTARAAAQAERSTRMFNFYMRELNLDATRATSIVERMSREFGIMPTQVEEAVQVLARQGASLQQIEGLLPAVAASASAAGADVGRAMEVAARGIAMNRSELLEQAGILANLGPAQQAYAKTIGVKVDALTEEQRITASINAVMRESQIELKAFRATVDPATVASQNLTASQQALTLAIGQFTLPILVELQHAAATVMRALTEWVQSEHFKHIVEQAQPYLMAFRDLVVAAWGAIATVWHSVLQPALTAIAPLLQATLQGLGTLMRMFTALFRGDFATIWDEWLAGIKRVAVAILATLQNLVNLILPLGRQLLDNLIRGISERVGAVQEAVTSVANDTVGVFAQMTQMTPVGRELLDSIIRGIVEHAGNLIRTVVTVATGVADAFVRTLQTTAIGRFILDNLVHGVVERADAAIQRVTTIANDIINALRGSLQVAPVGHQVAEDLSRGINERANIAASAARAVTTNVVGALKEPLAEATEIGRSITSNLVGGMGEMMEEHLAAFARRFYGSLDAALRAGFGDFNVLEMAFPDEMAEMHGRNPGERMMRGLRAELRRRPPIDHLAAELENLGRLQLEEMAQPPGEITLPIDWEDFIIPRYRGVGIEAPEHELWANPVLFPDLAPIEYLADEVTAILREATQALEAIPEQISLADWHEIEVSPLPSILQDIAERHQRLLDAEPEQISLADWHEIEVSPLPSILQDIAERHQRLLDAEPEQISLEGWTDVQAPTPPAPTLLQQMAGGIEWLLGPLASLSQILEALNPVAAVVSAFMERLGPVIATLMEPMIHLGEILAVAVMPVLQVLAPVLQVLALTVGGIVLALAHAWNAIAWLVKVITFGAVRLFVDIGEIERSLNRMISGTDRSADALERFSNSLNLVAGYGFTGVALRTQSIQVNVYGVLDPARTHTEVRSYHAAQTGRYRWS